jgi:hypothetical protein
VRTLGFLLVAVLVVVCLGSTAEARALHYQVTVTVAGPGHVTGSGNGGSIDCPGTCSALILQYTSITLTATADAGARFDGWGGDCAPAGTTPTCTLTLTGQGGNGSKSVSAGFDVLPPPPPPKFTLAVTKAGTGTGFVGGGGGIDCGPTCTSAVTKDEHVTLLAVADDGSTFAGWSGACSGTEPCALQIEADTQVTATFDHIDREPPHVSTLRATARHGTRVGLRFRIWDDSGKTREVLTVWKAKRKLVTIKVPLLPIVYRQVYTVRWRVPAKLRSFRGKFCAIGIDEAGNRSKRSCSLLVVT